MILGSEIRFLKDLAENASGARPLDGFRIPRLTPLFRVRIAPYRVYTRVLVAWRACWSETLGQQGA